MSIWCTFWGGCVPIQLNPVSPSSSGVFWPVLAGFQFTLGFLVSWGDLDETWNLQSLGCTIHSGLLIWMRGVLQGVSGGALQVVR